MSDSYGYYYLIDSYGEYAKLQVVDVQYEDEGFSHPTENRNIVDIISVKCPNCGKFSSFAIATAVIAHYVNGKAEVLLLKDNNDVCKLPIVLLQRLSDESFLPLCIMDTFIEKEE